MFTGVTMQLVIALNKQIFFVRLFRFLVSWG